MANSESDYYKYLQGDLLNNRYLRVNSLNEGSFGVVSIAKDTLNGNKLVAVKYNTGKLSDFEAYNEVKPRDNITNKLSSVNTEVKSFSLDSKTKSYVNLTTNSAFSNTSVSRNKDVSKSIVERETKQEILMLKKVDNHPNITKLIDSFGTFMVLEYAPRGDLHDAIHLGIAPVATADVIDVFMQLISAVEYCHKNGVYHRDIKPENILINDDWSIKLTDFGLATDRLICTDFDVGSERYMAPELLEHSDIDSYAADKVDIWALGICLLNIVFGKSPFRSASSKDKMFLHFAANRETLFDIFPFMSYDLFSVMIHSLTIDPANRDLEMIKQSLNNIDVLTYDYEFEEEVEDSKVSELSNDNEDQTEKNTNGSDQSNENEKSKSNSNPSTNHSNSKYIPAINIVREDNMFSIDSIIGEDEMDELDDIFDIPLFKDQKNKNSNTLSKPIPIQNNEQNDSDLGYKKYAVDTKRVSKYGNMLNTYNLSNHNNENKNSHLSNENNNNNYRVKRWNPIHRKPLRIANYNYKNQSQSGRYRNSFKDDSLDFNRKDFFTPKSVFSHYMEKAYRGKQQLQQHGNYYKRYGNNKENNFKYSSHNNNQNFHSSSNHPIEYDNVCYSNRRAWQKRRRRSSHAYNNNNNYRNKMNNNKSNFLKPNNRNFGSSWSNNHEQSSYNNRRSSHNPNNAPRVSSSLRASIDGKYVPPNLRLHSSILLGSAIESDDESDSENDIETIDGNLEEKYNRTQNNDNENKFDNGTDYGKHSNTSNDENDKENNHFMDEFSFDFEQQSSGTLRNSSNENISNTENYNNSFYQIESNAIDMLTKSFNDTKMFDERLQNSRDTSLTTTISNNFSSVGSNIGTSPKSVKKYIPPHQRRSSHSATETPNINIDKFLTPKNSNHHNEISMSAPTKSSIFFNNISKSAVPNNNDNHTANLIDSNDEQSDDLFDIEEN